MELFAREVPFFIKECETKMLLEELIDTFEEVKKYVFIINRGDKKAIVIRFDNEHFFHLVGLHKTNINMFFPSYIKTQAKKYKFMKNNIQKYNNIIENQIKEKNTLELRIKTFRYILDLLKSNNNTILYNLKNPPVGSRYDGDYGLLKIYEQINCLFGLKQENENNNIIHCAPQSWMASNRVNQLVEFKKPIYMRNITTIPKEYYNINTDVICT